MRIRFLPIKPINTNYLKREIFDFNLTNLLFNFPQTINDKIIINYIQSYSDHCRYDLHIVKGNIPYIKDRKIMKGGFCFMEIKTWFNLPFNFVLYKDTYVNYWGKDSDIDIIKPFVFVASNEERHLAIAGFRSLAASFYRRLTDLIGEENGIIAIKNDDKFVIAFKLNQKTEKVIDSAIEYFCNAVYELIKATEFYGYYEIPEINYKVEVSMAEQYKLNQRRNFMKKPRKTIQKFFN